MRAGRTARSTRTSSSTASPTPPRRTSSCWTSWASTRTYNHYPTGWAWAFNTPFKMWKRYANFEGGTADPLIVSWPAGIKDGGTPPAPVLARGRHRADPAGERRCRDARQRERLHPAPDRGHQLRYSFDDADAPTQKETQFYSMLGTRAIWHKGWKAATAVPAAPESWGDFHQQKWELFDTRDRSERVRGSVGQAPGEAAGARRALVDRGGQAPGAAARVARRDRDPGDRAAAAHGAEEPVHLFPGRRRDPRVGRPQHPQPLVHARRRGGDRRPEPKAC